MNANTERKGVDVLVADVAAARRERDEAREAQEHAELELAYLANEMMFNGNSIGWIASKADNYKAALGRAWDAFTATGGKCDGRTELADAIRQRGADVAELIEAACDPNVTGTCDKETRIRARQRLQRALARVGGA